MQALWPAFLLDLSLVQEAEKNIQCSMFNAQCPSSGKVEN